MLLFCFAAIILSARHAVVPSAGHDGRRSGRKPRLLTSEGRDGLLPFQLTAPGDEEDECSPAALSGS